MAIQKGYTKIFVENHMIPPIPNLDEFLVVYVDFKIIETKCEFHLYELNNWEFQKFEDASDEFKFWDVIFQK